MKNKVFVQSPKWLTIYMTKQITKELVVEEETDRKKYPLSDQFMRKAIIQQRITAYLKTSDEEV